MALIYDVPSSPFCPLWRPYSSQLLFLQTTCLFGNRVYDSNHATDNDSPKEANEYQTAGCKVIRPANVRTVAGGPSHLLYCKLHFRAEVFIHETNMSSSHKVNSHRPHPKKKRKIRLSCLIRKCFLPSKCVFKPDVMIKASICWNHKMCKPSKNNNVCNKWWTLKICRWELNFCLVLICEKIMVRFVNLILQGEKSRKPQVAVKRESMAIK